MTIWLIILPIVLLLVLGVAVVAVIVVLTNRVRAHDAEATRDAAPPYGEDAGTPRR